MSGPAICYRIAPINSVVSNIKDLAEPSDPHRRGPDGISARCRHGRRLERHHYRLRGGEWPPHGLYSGDQTRRRLDAGRRQRGEAVCAQFQSVVPSDIKIDYEFDQSPYVRNALHVGRERGTARGGADGLMVLLFLRDWRSALIVVATIPFALADRGCGAVGRRPDGQHYDAWRPGAGRRNSCRRIDGRDGKHPQPS